jgi:hypothetical protein
MDISGSDERPTYIGFKSQEGDCGLQKSNWARGRDGGAIDILLRGGVWLSESCSMEDESYFTALIRMFERSLEFVSSLPPAERVTYLKRLDKLRSRGRNVGCAIEEELNSHWYAALDEHRGE